MSGLNPDSSSPLAPRRLPAGGIHVLHAGYRHVLPKRSVQPSVQPDWRLYWADRSGPIARWPGRRQTMEPGRVWLVPPMQAFARSGAEPFISIHLFFRCEWRLPRDQVMVLQVDRGMLAFLKDLAASLEGRRLQAAACQSTALIAALLAQVDEPPALGDGAIARLLDEWNSAPPDALPDNCQAAASLGMGTDGFIRRFTRALGTTPGAWRTDYRLREAARLLRAGISLEEVRHRCGWRSRSSFTDAFRAAFGLPPGEWQRRGPG